MLKTYLLNQPQEFEKKTILVEKNLRAWIHPPLKNHDGSKISRVLNFKGTHFVHQMRVVLQQLQDIVLDTFHDILHGRLAEASLPKEDRRDDGNEKMSRPHDSWKGSEGHQFD